MRNTLLLAFVLVWACGAQTDSSKAPAYRLLYSPTSQVPGAQSIVMFEVTPGLFYLLSALEGPSYGASVFTLTGSGKFNLIYSLQPYTQSYALVQATNGMLYGPGFIGQSNANTSFYFSLDPSGQNPRQYPFPGKSGSLWQTLVVPPGKLYDIVAANPTQSTRIYGFASIAESGTIKILHEFSSTEGAPTGANIVYGPDGNIYGIGNQQANGGPGFIFRFTPTGSYSQLVTFPALPSILGSPLVAASDGNLYGAIFSGGTNNTGTVYQATLSGQLQTVANFPATGMSRPETLMEAADGNLYGTSNSNDIFRYNLATHQLSRVYHLAVGQGRCSCELIEGMDGKLYGVTPSGGNSPGIGAVFSLNIGLPKPTPGIAKMYPASGPPGQTVLLWGNYLLGATSVAFNGVLATSVSITSTKSVLVTVPAGATTGPVTVTTANGSFTTTQNFTVQ